MVNDIRDRREKKGLSQDDVADAVGITYSAFCRIEAGRGKTTPEEVKSVLAAIRTLPNKGRRVVGRPFKDEAKQAAATLARELGTSVSAAIADAEAAPPAKAAPRKAAAKPARAKAKA